MTPEVISTVAAMRLRVHEQRAQGRSIGVVPTMGALHTGHGVLIDQAVEGSDYVAVTIFVNPIQFDRKDDFERYARNLESDVAFCAERGVHAVFAPAPEEMYPRPQLTFIEVTGVQDHLCGHYRPGHFRGVATVVAKLFNVVAPDRAWFGEKDAQQLAVIQRMVADLNMPVEIVPVATVREPDGLAMSSRNQRLSPEERRIAPILYEALSVAQRGIAAGNRDAEAVREAAVQVLGRESAMRVEYVEVADASSMTPVVRIEGPVRIAGAVWIGGTRLIDNVYCEV
jgi:pantoate--beta-alanine ligase